MMHNESNNTNLNSQMRVEAAPRWPVTSPPGTREEVSAKILRFRKNGRKGFVYIRGSYTANEKTLNVEWIWREGTVFKLASDFSDTHTDKCG